MNKIKTIFLNFKHLKQMLLEEINILTAQRLMNNEIKNFVVKTNVLKTKPNPDLLEQYKKLCK